MPWLSVRSDCTADIVSSVCYHHLAQYIQYHDLIIRPDISVETVWNTIDCEMLWFLHVCH